MNKFDPEYIGLWVHLEVKAGFSYVVKRCNTSYSYGIPSNYYGTNIPFIKNRVLRSKLIKEMYL